MNSQHSFGSSPPEYVVLCLRSESNAPPNNQLIRRLESIFPSLNWRSHIYIVSDHPKHEVQLYSEVIGRVADFLSEQNLSTIYVHPFLHLKGTDIGPYDNLMNLMHPFQQEAYDRQSEVRMLILPIIVPDKRLTSRDLLSIAEYFRNRLAKPSFYFKDTSKLDPQTVLERDLRIYIDEHEPTVESTVVQLRVNHVFESILERVETGQSGLLHPCRRHLILDENIDGFYTCFDQRANGLASDSIDLPSDIDCTGCISRSCLAMEQNLIANGKHEEGRQVSMALAIALSQQNRYSEGAEHAGKAFCLSASDSDKSAALLHQGLCHLSLMQYNQADELLKAGAALSDEPGLFAYHRGTVEFARQNYLEAANLFHQAMAAPSDEIRQDDLLFNLGMSLVNLERFHEARSHFDRMEKVIAPVRFYQGICDLGQGLIDKALSLFREALELGPAREDLSRVLFYIGNCLKELGRYEEAITVLNEAILADPADYMNHNLIGFCFFKTKQYEKAIAAFHQAIEINPGSAIDYASIGSNLRELGRYKDAIAMYHMALSLDPGLDFARENILRLEQILARDPSEP